MRNVYKNKIKDLRHLTREEIKSRFYNGWSSIIDTTYDLIDFIPHVKIVNAIRDDGMLHFYVEGEEPYIYAAEGIVWKMERVSTSVCEKCGKHGYRRKELKKIICLCHDCYFQYLNEFETPEKVFRKGMESPHY